MLARATLKEWMGALELEEDCPYVGPRPQNTRDGKRMLVGRDKDLERINEAVLDRSLVVLDGYSGAGKSSLLQNGLHEWLEEAGLAVLISRKWGEIPADSDWSDAAIERYVADRIRKTHEEVPGKGLPLRPPIGRPAPTFQELRSGGLCRKLDDIYKESGAILILDQFEELLRSNKKFAEKVVKWIISIGYHYRTQVIISLRTDSLHLLDPLLRGVKPFSMDRLSVEEIKDEKAIKKVIETQRDYADRSSSRGPELEAVDRLLDLWREHSAKLLDLQATLFVLFFRARSRQETPSNEAVVERAHICADDVTKFEHDAEKAGRDPFTFGLREAIRLKIEHAETAARNIGLDDYLISGTREIVRRAAPLLSSGEFKVPIREVDLVQRTLMRERQILGSDALSAKFVEDLLSDVREAQAREADLLTLGWRDISRLSSSVTDPLRHRGDVTAGPMMSSPANAALFEEIRRVAFAIEWLNCTEITRKEDDGWLLLVHDGSGSALIAWAAKHDAGSGQALRQLTAARGEHYVWDREIGGETCKVIANLNWRDCRISTRFRNVVFVNCDFSGSRFDSCAFQGVTFVNCLLDDANFEYCEIRGVVDQGRVDREDKRRLRLAPSFTIEASGDEVRFFAPYLQGHESESLQFFSDTSGKPAVPGSPPEDHQGEVIAHFTTSGQAKVEGRNRQKKILSPTTGGVAMVGGRLCFLTLYRCRSEEGGSIAFHHVSGGGLDIVEQYGGRIDIHDGVIRGISVTRDLDRDSRRLHKLDITVNKAIVANLYFSDELAGTASFEDSRVMMLINAGKNSVDGFQVTLKDCRYQCLINTDKPDGVEDSSVKPDKVPNFARVDDSESCFELLNREALAKALEAMDYRSRAEVWEEEQRKRVLAATPH